MRLVLDTNVVIDWLVFDDRFMDPLRRAVQERRVNVLSHPFAAEELRRVLAYPAMKLSGERQIAIRQRYSMETSAVRLDESGGLQASLPKGFPRCRDKDDDVFLAFAYLTGADGLVSRDKAILKLKRRALKFGLRILDVQEMIAALASWRLTVDC